MIHWDCYLLMAQYSQKIIVQLPNEFSRVCYLLINAIKCVYLKLLAVMDQVLQDKKPLKGMHNNFEKSVACLIKADTIARKQKLTQGNVLSAESDQSLEANVSAFDDKSGNGSINGVYLRYNIKDEFSSLTKAESTEM